MTLRDRILAFADAQVGVKENPIGSNRGLEVDAYNLAAGAPMGSPWCLSMAVWCVQHACAHAQVPLTIMRTGSCHLLYHWAVEHGNLTQEPQPGDIGLLRGGPNGHDHAVIAETLHGHLVDTVEGNSNTDGSREGYEVVRHQRVREELDWVSTGG